MSVLVVGLSHKSAPVSTLERAAVSGDTLGKLLHDVARLPDIAETFVISTCNRVEVYAEVGRFHGGVAGVCDLLSRYSGIPAAELTSSLYVHYEDRAVQHLLAVSSGLESMVVGEDQILGQVRTALKVAGDHGTLGRSLRDLGRLALRTGKRARAETGIDRLGLSLVSVGIELAAPHLGGAQGEGQDQDKLVSNGPGRLSGAHVLVVGAGAMSGLAVATAARAGAAQVTVANRTRARAERLAAGVGGEVGISQNLFGEHAPFAIVLDADKDLGTVARWKRAVGRDRRMGQPDALRRLACFVLQQRNGHPVGDGIEHRHRQLRAFSGSLPHYQSFENGLVGVQSGRDIDNGHADARRFRRPGDGGEPGLGLNQQIVSLSLGERSVLAEA